MPDTSHLYGTTPFQRHLSYFDYSHTGLITIPSSVRACLSIGLNFPASCMFALGMQCIYGNTGFLGLRGIRVSSVPANKQRTQLQDVPTGKTAAGTAPAIYDRAGIMSLVHGRSMMDKIHAVGFWALAANREGFVSARDVELFQKGEVLPALNERRRESREDVIPFLRGGPGM